MTQEQLLLDHWRDLPPEDQLKLLTFAKSLRVEASTSQPRPNIKGICADTHPDLTLEDFNQVRKEAWATFPHEEYYS